MPLGERSYSVLVGKGAVSQIHKILPASSKRAVVVTQSGIAAIPDLEIPTLTIHIPAGEEHKSLSTIEDLCRQFAQFGLTRNDVVIGVGGGLVTDIAGFAAASYHRGTAVVHVSTTLLAMVDAAIAQQADAWAKYCAGEEKAMGALVGAIMKASQGKADGKVVTAILQARRAK